ncbi:hypothetical protein AVEN_195170-1 [Araneus ventricosus]|uniref:Uncharacterized protein n=1 Tax=Araneus ventricosus TaxID=182803 RepID=A0A4Y2T6F5_ARAVE|nr:hypothetical protein AVEN_195170-1 [Araneus ventricosus]
MTTRECGLDHRPRTMEPASANSPDALASVRLPNQAMHACPSSFARGAPYTTHRTSTPRPQIEHSALLRPSSTQAMWPSPSGTHTRPNAKNTGHRPPRIMSDTHFPGGLLVTMVTTATRLRRLVQLQFRIGPCFMHR